MKISLISALTNNYVIGKSNRIPWFLPNDMLWFKYHTLNKPIIMGRKTFESLGSKPLKNRLNIILSKSVNFQDMFDTVFVTTPEEAIWVIRKRMWVGMFEVMVIGGEKVYNIFFPYAHCLYLTCLNIDICGDAFFPRYSTEEWRMIFNLHLNNGIRYTYDFKIFRRV